MEKGVTPRAILERLLLVPKGRWDGRGHHLENKHQTMVTEKTAKPTVGCPRRVSTTLETATTGTTDDE